WAPLSAVRWARDRERELPAGPCARCPKTTRPTTSHRCVNYSPLRLSGEGVIREFNTLARKLVIQPIGDWFANSLLGEAERGFHGPRRKLDDHSKSRRRKGAPKRRATRLALALHPKSQRLS